VPQVQWAPAWVSWHQSDGCIGWAPLHPSARFGAGGVLEVNERMIPPRAFVFVEERRFLDPIRPATVINNTTIINKTVNITNIKVVNNTVINEGPRTDVIERASGRRVQAVPAHELRSKSEAPVASHRPGPAQVREKTAQQPPVVRNQPAPHETRPAVTTEPRPIEKPATATPPPPRTPALAREPTEVKNPVPPPAQIKPEIARQQAPQAPTEPKAEKRAGPAAQREEPPEKKGQSLSELRHEHEPVGRESKTNLVHKPQKKTEEQPKAPERN
jgi:hypothetical protein